MSTSVWKILLKTNLKTNLLKMGSVIDYIECPNCKLDALTDFYYRTGEEYTFCSNCGYYKTITIKDKRKKLSELEEEDFVLEEIINPFGAYKIKGKDSIASQIGVLESEDHLVNFINFVNKNNNEIELATYSRLIDGEVLSTIIVDNGPKFDSAGFSEEDR